MKIVDLIGRDMLVPSLAASDKRGILEELAGHIASRNSRIDRATLTRILIDREALASTAIGEGVAIPHGKLAAVSEIVACLGRAPAGVDFDSMDKPPDLSVLRPRRTRVVDRRPPQGAREDQPGLQGPRLPASPA
jgi:PTS system nitrogen regulatory IIA component